MGLSCWHPWNSCYSYFCHTISFSPHQYVHLLLACLGILLRAVPGGVPSREGELEAEEHGADSKGDGEAVPDLDMVAARKVQHVYQMLQSREQTALKARKNAIQADFSPTGR